MSLISQLRHHLILAGGFDKLTKLIYRMRQRLFAEHMLSASDCIHARYGMCMVRRGYRYRVDFVIHLIQHLAKIMIMFGPGILLKLTACTSHIHVAQCNYIFSAAAADTGSPSPANADTRNVQLLTGWSFTCAQYVPRHNRKCCNSPGCFMQKPAPRRFSNVLIHNISSKCFLALSKKITLKIPSSALESYSLNKILYLAACYNSYLGRFKKVIRDCLFSFPPYEGGHYETV
jgi:hypothetical protein